MRQCVAVNRCRDTSYEHGFVCGACLVAGISEHWGAAVCQGFLGIAGAVQGPVNACTSMWAANEAWPASSKGRAFVHATCTAWPWLSRSCCSNARSRDEILLSHILHSSVVLLSTSSFARHTILQSKALCTAAAHVALMGAVMLGLVRRIGDGPPNLLKAMSTIFTTHNLSSPISCCNLKRQKECCNLDNLYDTCQWHIMSVALSVAHQKESPDNGATRARPCNDFPLHCLPAGLHLM